MQLRLSRYSRILALTGLLEGPSACRLRPAFTASTSCFADGQVGGKDLAATSGRASTCGRTVTEHPRHWEVPGLIAALDAGIAPRLLARHPATGWCRSCRTTAPCSVRQLAEAGGMVGPA
jgi:hypothetical protein